MNIEAINKGEAKAKVARGVSASIVSVGVSSQPTESWYDTGVVIGDRASITARKELIEADWKDPDLNGKYALNIDARTNNKATSKVSAVQVGVAFNLNYMKGENSINEENNIDIGTGANLWAKGSMNISNSTSTEAEAVTDLDGGGIIDGTAAFADNIITRRMRINLSDRAHLTSDVGSVNLKTISGAGDKIVTKALIDNGGLIAVGNGTATTKLTSENQINVGKEVEINSYGDINLNAVATSHQANGEEGVLTKCDVNTYGAILIPNADADVVMNLTTYININRKGKSITQLKTNGAEPRDGNINIRVSNQNLNVYAYGHARAGGVGGGSDAEADITANNKNTIWVDKANLMAQGYVNLKADNRGSDSWPVIKAESEAELYGGGGACDADSYLRGTPYNQIKSTNTRNVRVTGKNFTHTAVNPYDDTEYKLTVSQQYSPPPLIIIPGGDTHNDWKMAARNRCDFCLEGTSSTVDSVTERSTSSAMKTAREKALAPISTLNKTLDALRDIQRSTIEDANVFKARVEWDDTKAAGALFDIDTQSILNSDMLLTRKDVREYRLWNNIDVFRDVYMLPNATRLYAYGDMVLQYVAEVLRGDIRGNGVSYDIDIVIPLTRSAGINPVIPIGSTGSLNFNTCELKFPAQAQFELYLHEISGEWLLEKLDENYIRRLDANEAISADAIGGDLTANATIIQGMTEDSKGLPQNIRRFWLEDTPETAKDPDQVLVYIVINEQTDEVDAFRTSVNMIARGAAPVDVSLWLFRDSNSDRKGLEVYNALFFDTPAGTPSKVVVSTDVVNGKSLEIPRPLRIVLRTFWLGASGNMPACSILDHFYTVQYAEDGIISAFDGAYRAELDDDIFESDYTRIEGLLDGNLNITIKAGQPVWQSIQTAVKAG